MLEFIHKKTGRKMSLEEGDTIRINALIRAGYIQSGEYVAPVVEEVVPEPTVGEVVDSIAEANPEPEVVPMVAVEAVHEDVDPTEFVELLNPPSGEEESDGEEGEGSEDASNGGSDEDDETGYSETGSEEEGSGTEEESIAESVSGERASDDDVLGAASVDGIGSEIEGSGLSDIPIG